MGMRAQVLIEDTGVYLYTHWGSEELPEVVRQALASEAGQARLRDPEYLARIIFEAMIANGSLSKEIGFGIGTIEHSDLEYPAIAINCQDQTIRLPENEVMRIDTFVGRLSKTSLNH